MRALRAGNFAEVAARHAGVHPATYYRWMERGAPGSDAPADEPYRQFRAEVERALADAEALYVGLIVKAGQEGHWQAASFLLERRFPERWRRPPSRATPVIEEFLAPRRDRIDAEVERLVAEMEERERGEKAEPG